MSLKVTLTMRNGTKLSARLARIRLVDYTLRQHSERCQARNGPSPALPIVEYKAAPTPQPSSTAWWCKACYVITRISAPPLQNVGALSIERASNSRALHLLRVLHILPDLHSHTFPNDPRVRCDHVQGSQRAGPPVGGAVSPVALQLCSRPGKRIVKCRTVAMQVAKHHE